MKKRLKLIEVWGEESVQAMLEGSKRNRDVFNKIAAREMRLLGTRALCAALLSSCACRRSTNNTHAVILDAILSAIRQRMACYQCQN